MRYSLLFLLFSVFLSGCTANVANTQDIAGLWADNQNRLYFLDTDGSLALPGQTDIGVNWRMENGALTLSTLDSPKVTINKKTLFLKKYGKDSLIFTDAEGSSFTWKKSQAKVGNIEGTLFYRERMVLPPQAMVYVQIFPMNSQTPMASALMPAAESGEIPFRVYCLEQTAGNFQLRAEIIHNGETLFATQNNETITLPGSPSVLLYRAMPKETHNSPTLLQTYWRMSEINGKAVEQFQSQPEPHLIFKEDGQAIGSDGCNNFFMSWKREGQNLRFLSGGSTLRLCPQGDEQARAIHSMFTHVDEWNITGSRLVLRSQNSVIAVFEAVNM